MELTKEEFGDKFNGAVDSVLLAMAEHEKIDPEKFYSMTCILENLAFFSPLFYDIITDSKKIK